MRERKYRFETEAVHHADGPDEWTGAVIPPMSVSSTYAFKSIGKRGRYVYGRSQNPSRETLERKLARLEGAKFAYTYGSGMAAVHAASCFVKPGETILCIENCYGGTHELFTQFYRPRGIGIEFRDFSNLKEASKQAALLKPALAWIESPTNPLMKICDIAAISGIMRLHGCKVAVDNTFSGPYIQRPIELGADLSVYSGTKYIGGHSDLSLGAVMTDSEDLRRCLKLCQHAVGGIPGSLEVFLANRSLKTLMLRLGKQSENAAKLVKFLSRHHKVRKVYYPGLDGRTRNLAKRQMKLFGGIFAFELDASPRGMDRFIKSLRLFAFAASLGAVESLIAHPATMTHESLTEEERESMGIGRNLVRISTGVEDARDLLEDLDAALRAV